MTLTGVEWLSRDLLHVLLKGFMRVCHFGFLANRGRAQRLPAIRMALAAPPPAVAEQSASTATIDGSPCPTCRTGRLRITAHLAPAPGRAGCRAGVTTRTKQH